MTMTTTDPIADMLARIRNAIAVRKNEIVLPHSSVKEAVARLLQANHYVKAVSVSDARVGKDLRVVINAAGSNATITEIHRVSTPGRRQYTKAGQIPVVKQGRGIVILSTSKGLMTGRDAQAQGLGGELICKVY